MHRLENLGQYIVKLVLRLASAKKFICTAFSVLCAIYAWYMDRQHLYYRSQANEQRIESLERAFNNWQNEIVIKTGRIKKDVVSIVIDKARKELKADKEENFYLSFIGIKHHVATTMYFEHGIADVFTTIGFNPISGRMEDLTNPASGAVENSYRRPVIFHEDCSEYINQIMNINSTRPNDYYKCDHGTIKELESRHYKCPAFLEGLKTVFHNNIQAKAYLCAAYYNDNLYGFVLLTAEPYKTPPCAADNKCYNFLSNTAEEIAKILNSASISIPKIEKRR